MNAIALQDALEKIEIIWDSVVEDVIGDKEPKNVKGIKVKTGGKQYKVKSGEILKIEKLPDSKPETKIEFNEILAYGDDKFNKFK